MRIILHFNNLIRVNYDDNYWDMCFLFFFNNLAMICNTIMMMLQLFFSTFEFFRIEQSFADLEILCSVFCCNYYYYFLLFFFDYY